MTIQYSNISFLLKRSFIHVFIRCVIFMLFSHILPLIAASCHLYVVINCVAKDSENINYQERRFNTRNTLTILQLCMQKYNETRWVITLVRVLGMLNIRMARVVC